ncbi:MAG: cation:proton antiporter [Saprospiraceae bacterium]|nr:cation:proton antiporter [Saprospiraceae bacterium]
MNIAIVRSMLGDIHTDIIWLSTAFVLGFLAMRLRLPSLIGFLFTGLLLNYFEMDKGNAGNIIEALADLGVMLLLFTIGLKIKVNTVFQPMIWIPASINMVVSVVLAGGFVFLLGLTGLQTFAGLDMKASMLIGFALSFSSTVFVVKILEERGELTSFHGKIAIGILVIQDIFAVLFMTMVSDQTPSWFVLLLPLYLYLIRYPLSYLLAHAGHGEMLTIFGFFATFVTGAFVFHALGLKPDLGALIIGMLLVNHLKADELYDRMMSYKDFFLVAFFINIGFSGQITTQTLLITAILIPFMLVKGLLFVSLLSAFKMRARTAFLASLSLGNFSEFALITGVVGFKAGWISNDWIMAFALLMTLSFIISSPLNAAAHHIFDAYRPLIMGINAGGKYIDEEPKSIGNAEFLIIGFGSIGKPAYYYLTGKMGLKAIAIDYNHEIVKKYKHKGVNINWGDTSNSIFWETIDFSKVKVVLLAMSEHHSNLSILQEIHKIKNRRFKIAAFCKYEDEARVFREMKVDYIYDYKMHQGEDFAEQAYLEYIEEGGMN